MVLDERGSESVQFSFAAVLLIVVAFGIMQMAMMNAAAIMLSSELTPACMRLDGSGLWRRSPPTRSLRSPRSCAVAI